MSAEVNDIGFVTIPSLRMMSVRISPEIARNSVES
jgi:hypothetical protein